MAYKNQKKNKKHQAEIRKANSGKKCARKRQGYLRKHSSKEMTLAEMERMIVANSH